METKQLIRNLTLMLALFIGWRLAVSYELKKHPSWAGQPSTQPVAIPGTNTGSPTAPDAKAGTLAVDTSATQPATLPAGSSPIPTAVSTAVSAMQTPVLLGTDSTTFPMVLSINPQGAGLNSVILSDYFLTAAHRDLYKFQEPVVGFESQTRPLATRSVTVNGQDIDVSNVSWMLASSARDSATYVATISGSGKPLLELSKTFKLTPRNATDGSKGFDIQLNQSFRDLSDKPLTVSETLNGPTPPGRENDRSEDRRYVSAYDQGERILDTGGAPVTDLKKDKPGQDLATVNGKPLLWVGACSSYFEAILRPDYAGRTTAPAVKIASAMAAGIDPGVTSLDPITGLTISTNDFTLQPGQSIPFNSHVFFGPKQRQLLSDDSYYNAFPLHYDKTLVYTTGACYYVTLPWLINLLYYILAGFHWVTHDWGLAIIGLVCLVRVLLHPITKRSQINMLQMSKMGPEIERLKKKFGDDKDGLNKAMMNVYKEQGLTPILGCLPMFLQTPIWIALWSALQSTFELRQAGFLRWGHLHLTWIADLSHPDALYTFANPISIFGFFHLSSINVLPILMAGVFFLQQKMMPVPENMTPEQEQQRNMMKWMVFLPVLFLYLGPSGLNLYILTSTTLGIVESKIIRDHIKQREAAEKSGKIIIDAPPTRATKRRKDDELATGKPGARGAKKPGGLAGWFAELQAKAEEIRREAERKAK